MTFHPLFIVLLQHFSFRGILHKVLWKAFSNWVSDYLFGWLYIYSEALTLSFTPSFFCITQHILLDFILTTCGNNFLMKYPHWALHLVFFPVSPMHITPGYFSFRISFFILHYVYTLYSITQWHHEVAQQLIFPYGLVVIINLNIWQMFMGGLSVQFELTNDCLRPSRLLSFD